MNKNLKFKINNSKAISFSAPGKIHLLGEHSVTYGKPALLTAIDRRLKLSLILGKGEPITEIESAQQAIEEEVKKRFKKTIPSYHIEIDSKIPVGSGNGSSAAISVCLTAALLKYLKVKWDKEIVRDISIYGESVFHGKSSGGDIAAVTYGGTIWFRKETESLKLVSPILLNSPINLILINSGVPKESTSQMVQGVAALKQKKPLFVEKILASQEDLTRKMAQLLISGESKGLDEVFTLGQRNLEKLGVVSAKSRGIIKSVEKAGGAAKILGGGGISEGSGMILCYHKDSKKLKALAGKKSWDTMQIKIDQEGLRQE